MTVVIWLAARIRCVLSGHDPLAYTPVEMTRLGQPRRELLRTCRECGLSWCEEGEWL